MDILRDYQRNRVDIVDKDGHLFRPGLYGKVKRQGDVFIGDNQRGETVYWDAKGGRFYQRMPTFEQLGRFAVARIGTQVYMRYSGVEAGVQRQDIKKVMRLWGFITFFVFTRCTRGAWELRRGCRASGLPPIACRR